jgi:hypothetical protein
LQREHELLMRYERDVEVTPQLWRGVAARIAAERAQASERTRDAEPFTRRVRGWLAGAFVVPRFSPALTAALVLVAVALTAGAMKLMEKDGTQTVAVKPMVAVNPSPASPSVAQASNANKSVAQSTPEPSVATPNQEQRQTVAQVEKPVSPRRAAPKNEANSNRSLPAQFQQAAAKGEPTAEELVREAEAKYLKAIEILSRDVNRRRATLDAQTLARFDETLNAIDRTIAETRRAALTRGNDPVAVQYMLTAYEKKVDVLRELARAD